MITSRGDVKVSASPLRALRLGGGPESLSTVNKLFDCVCSPWRTNPTNRRDAELAEVTQRVVLFLCRHMTNGSIRNICESKEATWPRHHYSVTQLALH